MTKTEYVHDKLICRMDGVREYAEGFPVELVLDGETRRLAIRALNEGGHNVTLIDVFDLLGWLGKNGNLWENMEE